MRIGMVGARFAGLDGVSLESAKLAEALRRAGHDIAWFAGEIGPGFSPSVVCASAAFDTDLSRSIQRWAFNAGDPIDVRSAIDKTAPAIAQALDAFIETYRVDGLIVENAWAIPMQLPLAVATADVVAERGTLTVGHHHDFSWERDRFSECTVPDIIETFFPPSLKSVGHVVINSLAQRDLLSRRTLESSVLPNVMDFASGPPKGDGGVAFRQLAGVDEGTPILLQPTRVIRRKGIELTLDLATRMATRPVVIVTHPDDLDTAYWRSLMDTARTGSVDLRLVDAGRDIEALASAYQAADLVCLPSLYEGYGNALVEAVYHRRPVMVNRYSVYVSDIEPLGFEFTEINGEVTGATVEAVDRIVADPGTVTATVERNFGIGHAELSFATAQEIIERAFERAAV